MSRITEVFVLYVGSREWDRNTDWLRIKYEADYAEKIYPGNIIRIIVERSKVTEQTLYTNYRKTRGKQIG